jgi:Hypothetical glycosyl hydrolase family 15
MRPNRTARATRSTNCQALSLQQPHPIILQRLPGALRSVTLALVGALFVLVSMTPPLAWSAPPFPRVAGVQIGAPFNYNDTSYQAAMARQDLTIIEDWPNFAPGGESIQSVVQAIKAINPKTLVFCYVEDNFVDSARASWPNFQSEIDARKWWLYPSGTTGSPVQSLINNTQYTAPDPATGYNSVQWAAHYFIDNLYTPAPAFDGFYMDNMFANAKADGDYNVDGTIDSHLSTTTSAYLQTGAIQYVNTVRPLMPGKYQIGNIGDWTLTPNNGAGAQVPFGYQQLLDGGAMEGFIGESYSIETWGGWPAMLDAYHRTMAVMNEPKLGIFNQHGSQTDYQGMRYGLASSLLDDGYFSYTDPSVGYTGVLWFDEFNVNLGAPLTPPVTTAWQSGVYRRDFENGIALVNPKGNSAATVTLETSYVKINGTQDHTTNNGSAVTSVTLQPRDGLILLRPSSATNNLGRSTIGSAPGSGMTADYKRGSSFTLAQNGVLTGFNAYMDGNGGASGVQDIRMVLYKDNNGVPGARVVQSDTVTIAAGMMPQWLHFTAPETAVSQGIYWIVIQTGGTQGVARDYGDGTGLWYANADTFSDGASDPFGSGSTGTTILSVNASFLPGTLETFGRTTPATSASSGMSADYKRGTPFTLADGGTLTSFSAYLDGNGGASGSQDVRMVLYQDSGGVPGNEVVQSSTVTIPAGMTPQWIRFTAPQTALTAGTYWIVIQTGQKQAIARNYGDGSTAWYANADTFWDGTSSPFGSGSTGTTTLSVYVSYVH